MPHTLPVLIVDDDKRMRELLVDIFKDLGHPIVSAADGEQAIQAINKISFALIITDLTIPEQNGFDVIRHAKGKNPWTQAILISGNDPSEAYNVIMNEPYDFIRKPFEPEYLLSVAKHALGCYLQCLDEM